MNLRKGDIVKFPYSVGKVVDFIFCPYEDFTTAVVQVGQSNIYKHKNFSKDSRRRMQRIWFDPKDLKIIRRTT